MVESSHATVAELLRELQAGNRAALNELFPLIYRDLQSMAHQQRRRWRGNSTLNTTALVHEAYLKLVDQTRCGVESRAHFLALAARAMRHILCNYARDRSRLKRGGRLRRCTVENMDALPARLTFSAQDVAVLIALDDALNELEREESGLSQVVECRFFGAMSIDDTAAALRISPATVKRRWLLARSWLYREMHPAARREE